MTESDELTGGSQQVNVARLAFVAAFGFLGMLGVLLAGDYVMRHYTPIDPWSRWVTVGFAVVCTLIATFLAYNDLRLGHADPVQQEEIDRIVEDFGSDDSVVPATEETYAELNDEFREWVEERYGPGIEGLTEFQKDMPVTGHVEATGRDWTYVTPAGVELHHGGEDDE